MNSMAKLNVKIVFASIFFLFQFALPGNTQILNRAANRLGQKVIERKIDREIEKKTDELADSIVNAMEKDKRTPEEKAQSAENRRKAGGMLGRMMGGMNQVELPPAYDFKQKLVMEMEDERGNLTEITMYHSAESPVIGYETGDESAKEVAFMVMDFEEEYLATFTESGGEKQVISMPLPMDMIMEMAEAENDSPEDYSIEKTGKTKSINGYKCEEYIITSEQIVQHIWVTQDVEMSNSYYSVIKNMARNNKRMGKLPEEWPQGVPMEIEIVDQKKNRKSYMRTKEFG